MKLSQCVKCCRNDKGVSQEFMADSLGMSQSTYARLEQNDQKCERLISKLATLLGLSIEALRNYNGTLPDTLATLQQQLTQQQQLIQQKTEEISFLRGQLLHMQSYLSSLMKRDRTR